MFLDDRSAVIHLLPKFPFFRCEVANRSMGRESFETHPDRRRGTPVLVLEMRIQLTQVIEASEDFSTCAATQLKNRCMRHVKTPEMFSRCMLK
jgi:hypothetical protein